MIITQWKAIKIFIISIIKEMSEFEMSRRKLNNTSIETYNNKNSNNFIIFWNKEN